MDIPLLQWICRDPWTETSNPSGQRLPGQRSPGQKPPSLQREHGTRDKDPIEGTWEPDRKCHHAETPMDSMTDTCKNITLPQISFAGGKKAKNCISTARRSSTYICYKQMFIRPRICKIHWNSNLNPNTGGDSPQSRAFFWAICFHDVVKSHRFLSHTGDIYDDALHG